MEIAWRHDVDTALAFYIGHLGFHVLDSFSSAWPVARQPR